MVKYMKCQYYADGSKFLEVSFATWTVMTTSDLLYIIYMWECLALLQGVHNEHIM